MINRIAFISLFVFAVATAACGGGDTPTTPDAAVTPGPDAAQSVAPTCATYCDTVTTNCVDTYTTKEACETSCTAATWEAGKADAEGAGANTIGCRQYHAELAATEAATHCPHAALHGGDTCGSDCDNYCAQFLKACSAFDGTANTYPTLDECLTTCGTFNNEAGSYNDADGNTLKCRLYQVGVALTAEPADAETRCLNAIPEPAAGCIDPI